MRGFATTTMLVLAVAGLSACNRNKAANNSATTNSAAPAPAAPAAPAADKAMDPAVFRAALAEQCAQTLRAQPGVPAGIDISGICTCATETTLAGRSDPFAFTQTPEGQQVFNQALNQCLQQSIGSAGGAAAPAADGADEGEEAPE